MNRAQDRTPPATGAEVNLIAPAGATIHGPIIVE